MAINFFVNTDGTFKKNVDSGIDGYKGWWNSISGGDFDNDGDIDYIAGNLGLNNNFQVQHDLPLKVYAKDFDGNGSVDPVLACYMRESMESDVKKLYPIHFWDELNSQSPKFRNKFSRYRQYSLVTIDQLLTADEMKGALVLEANHMASSYVENLGSGKFAIKSLPSPVQVAPVNGLVLSDVNCDGNLDAVLIGNDYGNEVFVGRYDALTGLVLLGDGHGSFHVIPSAESGFYVPGDAKALSKIVGCDGGEMFIATQNKDSVQVFRQTKATEFHVTPYLMESRADIIFEDGRNQRVELYYGSGYLSQSSRRISIPAGTKEIILHDFKGNSRKVVPALKSN